MTRNKIRLLSGFEQFFATLMVAQVEPPRGVQWCAGPCKRIRVHLADVRNARRHRAGHKSGRAGERAVDPAAAIRLMSEHLQHCANEATVPLAALHSFVHNLCTYSVCYGASVVRTYKGTRLVVTPHRRKLWGLNSLGAVVQGATGRKLVTVGHAGQPQLLGPRQSAKVRLMRTVSRCGSLGVLHAPLPRARAPPVTNGHLFMS